MLFKDRADAALRLTGFLEKYRKTNAIVMAIPRGGVPMGAIIAGELGLPLEIILSKKIGHPDNPEFAIGSVTLDDVVVNDNGLNIRPGYIEMEATRIKQELKRRNELFMGGREPLDVGDRTVIIVDDGIATGSTIQATITSLSRKTPRRIVVATPVASVRAAAMLRTMCDEFICLYTPEEFYGVGQFYIEFPQVSDEQVISLLHDSRSAFTNNPPR